MKISTSASLASHEQVWDLMIWPFPVGKLAVQLPGQMVVGSHLPSTKALDSLWSDSWTWSVSGDVSGDVSLWLKTL